MLHVALGTATAVASEHILASMLAPMVSITLIHIFTVDTRAVQGESFLTLAVVAPWCVQTLSFGSTQRGLSCALIIVNAGRVVLSEAWGTFAVESSNNVHTQELAVVLLGGTFIQVFADFPIFL